MHGNTNKCTELLQINALDALQRNSTFLLLDSATTSKCQKRTHTVAAAKLSRNGRKLKCVVTQYLDSHSKQEAMPRLRRKVRVGALHAPAFPLFAQHCQRESGCRCTNKLCHMLRIQICNTKNTKIRKGDDDKNEMINKLI